MHRPQARPEETPHGVIRNEDDSCVIEYYTLQPSPAQWAAVGRAATKAVVAARPRSLLVGTGISEDAAVIDLRNRCPKSDPVTFAMIPLELKERRA